MPWRCKIQTLANDIERRMRNCSRSLPIERRAHHLNQAMAMMKRSGYTVDTRVEVLLAGLRAYYKKVEREESRIGHINCPREEGAERRRIDWII